uniref:Uncharacterized protein n=1 Tax=Alexandrium catenella TaxID=2925 RepID=A0A7S1PK29_ALECA
MALPRRGRSVLPAALLAAVAGVACLSQATGFLQAPRGRRDWLLAAATGAAVADQALPAQAFGKSSEDWVGRYADPNHPGCRREINIAYEGVIVSGSDGTPGCLKGEKQINWNLMANWKPGDTLLFDFSSKGGPKDVEGKWEGDGIRFPDGNKWKRIATR